jgi:hypothetical protein
MIEHGCRLGTFTAAQIGAISSLFKHFQSASMDFYWTFRGIDFRGDAVHVPVLAWTSPLGVTISCQTSNLHIVPMGCRRTANFNGAASSASASMSQTTLACQDRLRAFAASGAAGIQGGRLENLWRRNFTPTAGQRRRSSGCSSGALEGLDGESCVASKMKCLAATLHEACINSTTAIHVSATALADNQTRASAASHQRPHMNQFTLLWRVRGCCITYLLPAPSER